MSTLMVLADDLTGTLDCAVQFSKQNIDVSVCVCDDDVNLSFLTSADVLVVNTDSRHIPEEEAAERVERLAEMAMQAGIRYFYKKIDSVLRGNVGVECLALMRQVKASELFMLPAFPDNGRVTRGGCQYYNDKLITDTVLGEDAFSTLRSSCIKKLIHAADADMNVRVVAVDEMMPTSTTEATVYVFDAETNGQLEQRTLELRERSDGWVAAGCAGFAEFIPLAVELAIKPNGKPLRASSALVVSGSLNPISLEQVRHMETEGFGVVYLSQEQAKKCGDAAKKAAELASETLESQGVVIVATDGDKVTSGEPIHGRQEMCGRISAMTAEIIRGRRDCALIVFGGDTSLGILRKLRPEAVRPVCEIGPGIVCSTLQNRDGTQSAFITKSGGFGDRDTISDILSFLKLRHTKEIRH